MNDKISASFTLIWLNNPLDSIEHLELQRNFSVFIQNLKIFINKDECGQYIQSSSKQQRFVLITSGQMGQDFIPHIHQLPQIVSIYIYCLNKKIHEEWSKEYKKVRAVTSQTEELIKLIRLEHEKYNHNKVNELVSISCFKTNIEQENIINGFNGDFIYKKCLIDFLLELKIRDNITDDFLYLCQEEYENNQIELNNIHLFEKDYSSNQALLWFTKNIFLRKILNKAFYEENINLLIFSRFFIYDLQQQIKQNQILTSIEVYHSQFISIDILEKLKNSIGHYILIDSFFSANINREQSFSYFDYITNSENLQSILFEIKTNPSVSFCYSSNQQEILFSLGSTFQLLEIHSNENQISIIRMVLCNDNDLNLKPIIDKIKLDDNYWTTDLLLLGTILQQKNKYVEAEQFYNLLLNELPHDHSDIDACYYSLGMIAYEKRCYKSSLEYYQLSLANLLRKNESNHSHLGILYYMIGEIYQKKEQFKEALEFYNKALQIWKETFDINQINIVKCFNNIALIYRSEKKYSEAISYYTQALSINEKYLPINHINLGTLHHNIGALHLCLEHYDDAIKHYNIALEIKYKSCSSEHSSIAMTLENLGLVYENQGNFQQALSYYEQAAKIYRKILPQTHSNVIQIDEALRKVSSKL
ncbi:unnamed protein product [Rotaria sordida]|uniref:Uncharacterized protein n=1 Tax=Rotaria sordida TaxID=392033 RepID=A0A814VCK4_9BILA|nr:unnamed protein product [Rotaria sordida]